MTLDSLMAAHCPPHLGGGARSDRACTVTRGGGMCYLCRAISCATSAERSHVLPLPRDLEHAHKLVVAHHLVLVAIRHAEPACTARGSMQVRNQAQHRAQAQDQALQGCTAASGPGSGSGSATRPGPGPLLRPLRPKRRCCFRPDAAHRVESCLVVGCLRHTGSDERVPELVPADGTVLVAVDRDKDRLHVCVVAGSGLAPMIATAPRSRSKLGLGIRLGLM